ncbi:MAG: hypothetical protein V4735_00345 [Pseudomonadota bacterium]
MPTNDPSVKKPASAASGAGADADTNIYITNGAPTPAAPTYTPPALPQPITGPRYGELQPLQDEPEATLEPIETRTKTSINWGGVIKGIAIVAAVAVVAVVGVIAAQYLAGVAFSSPFVAETVSTLSGLATQAATAINGYWSEALLTIGKLQPLSWFGLSSSAAVTGTLSAAQAATALTATQAAGAVGGLAAGAVVLHTALPAIHTIDLTSTTTVTTPPAHDPNLLSSVQSTHMAQTNALANAHTLHELTHISHHAAEHGSQEHTAVRQHTTPTTPEYSRRATEAMAETTTASRNWMERIGARPAAAIASRAEALRTKQPVQPRDPNFAADLEAKRAALDVELTQQIH